MKDWSQEDWIFYKIEDMILIVKNDVAAKIAKQIMQEQYPPYTVVRCYDLMTLELKESLKLEDLY